MSETAEQPTTGSSSRERVILARKRHEEATQALRTAQARPKILDNDLRELRAQRDNTAEVGHRGADLLQDGAEARFQALLKDYIGQLPMVEAEAADAPSGELVTAFVLARLGGEFFAVLHAAVDAAVDDNSISAYSGGATAAEVEAKIATKRDERRAAAAALEEAEAALEAASVEVEEAQSARERR